MNHHELLAGVPGVQRVMQAFARRVAGLGRLPKETVAPRAARRRTVDVLVVGAGASGMASALELTRRGRRVEVVDDALTWGGSLRALAGPARAAWEPLLRAFDDAVTQSLVSLRLETTAAGIYGDDVLVGGPDGIEVVTARTLVLAPGAHDGVLAFEGNDVPGVMSARAAGWLLAHGTTAGQRVVVTVTEGGGPFGEALSRAQGDVELVWGVPTRVRGSARVKEVTVVDAKGERRLRCDALLVDAPRAPAYELCAQVGAELRHEPRGFVARVAKGGVLRPGVLAVGEVVGTPLDLAQVVEESRQLVD
jgi:sarcosine oxidase subunit alpha